jgi:hypothetical protein
VQSSSFGLEDERNVEQQVVSVVLFVFDSHGIRNESVVTSESGVDQ